jgi:hypothetical protein
VRVQRDRVYGYHKGGLKFEVLVFAKKYWNIKKPSLIVIHHKQARIQKMPVEGDDPVRRNKTGGGLGAAVGPQWGPGAEPLVGVEGRSPPKLTPFYTFYNDFLRLRQSLWLITFVTQFTIFALCNFRIEPKPACFTSHRGNNKTRRLLLTFIFDLS